MQVLSENLRPVMLGSDSPRGGAFVTLHAGGAQPLQRLPALPAAHCRDARREGAVQILPHNGEPLAPPIASQVAISVSMHV